MSESHSWRGVKISREGRNPKVHGEIPGFPIGSTWENRIGCSEAGVHAPLRAGIHGNADDGAFSIVLSGGYEDDEDKGEIITYTGEGGRDTKGSKMDQLRGKIAWEGQQSADQEWVRGNKALKISCTTKKPVRVIRGHTLDSQYAPAEGYRYDGLYVVEDAWRAVGKTGFKTCRFTFKRLPGQPPLPGSRPVMHIKKLGQSSKTQTKVTAPSPRAEAGPSRLPQPTPSMPRELEFLSISPRLTIAEAQDRATMKPSSSYTIRKPIFTTPSSMSSAPPIRQRAPVEWPRANPRLPTFLPSGVNGMAPRAAPSSPNLIAPLRMQPVMPPRTLKRPRLEDMVVSESESDSRGSSITPEIPGRWSAVEGKKKYDGLRFKKNKKAGD